MKNLLIALFFLTFTFTAFGQIASVDNLDHAKESIVSEIETAPLRFKSKTYNSISLSQLSDSISNELKKNTLLQKHINEGSLLLEINIDKEGIVKKYLVADCESKLLNETVMEFMQKIEAINVENLDIQGGLKIKMPVHYFK